MNSEADLRAPFVEFAGPNGDYYADIFLKIQKSTLGQWHIHKAALLGSFVWSALRGSWLLFAIGFLIDLIAAVNLALVWKYSNAAIANADKDFLMARNKGWTSNHLIAAIVTYVLGRLLFGWLADRFNATQYSR